MFGMLKRSWSHLPRSFNIVEQAHAQLRRRSRGHHGCKDGNKARQFFVWLIVRANLSFGDFIPTKDLFTSKILFDVAQHSLEDGMTHSHLHIAPCLRSRVLSRCCWNSPFHPFFWSIALFFPFRVFYPHDSKLRKLQKLLITSELCCKHTREPLSFQNGALACLRRERSWDLKLITRPLAKFCWMKCWNRLLIPRSTSFNNLPTAFNKIE